MTYFSSKGESLEKTWIGESGRRYGAGVCDRCGGNRIFNDPRHLHYVAGGQSGGGFKCAATGTVTMRAYTEKEYRTLAARREKARDKREADQAATRAANEAAMAQAEKDRMAREAEEAARVAAEKARSQYIGNVGERREFRGTVRFVTSGEGMYGRWYLTAIDTADGVVLYWNHLGAERGDAVSFTARIKDHSERDGEKQTVVQRATKIEILEQA